MDQVQSITNPIREKGKHLTFEYRVVIQTRLRDKWSICMACPPTIRLFKRKEAL